MREAGAEQDWGELSRRVGAELAVWRREHPRASLRAIEEALEERWVRVRAQLLQEAAEASAARDLQEQPATCPACGGRVREKSWETRQLSTAGDQTLRLTRSLGDCSGCGQELFPPR